MMVTTTAILMVVAKYKIAFSVFFSPSHFLRRRSDNKRYNSTVRNFPMHFRRCRRFIPHGYRFVVPLFSFSVSNAPRAIDWSIVSSDTGIFYWAASFCIYASLRVATRDNWPKPTGDRSLRIFRGSLRDDICVEDCYKSYFSWETCTVKRFIKYLRLLFLWQIQFKTLNNLNLFLQLKKKN